VFLPYLFFRKFDNNRNKRITIRGVTNRGQRPYSLYIKQVYTVCFLKSLYSRLFYVFLKSLWFSCFMFSKKSIHKKVYTVFYVFRRLKHFRTSCVLEFRTLVKTASMPKQRQTCMEEALLILC